MHTPLRHTPKHWLWIMGIMMFCVCSSLTADARSGGSASGGSVGGESTPGGRASAAPNTSYSPPSSSYTPPSHTDYSAGQSDGDEHSESTSSSGEVEWWWFLAAFTILVLLYFIGVQLYRMLFGMYLSVTDPPRYEKMRMAQTRGTWGTKKVQNDFYDRMTPKKPRDHVEDVQSIHTLLLEVSMSDATRTIQQAIERFTTRAKLNTSEGRHAYITMLLLMLRQHSDAMSHARSETDSMSAEEANSYLNQVSFDARVKFERNIMRKTETREMRAAQRNVTSPDGLFDEDGDFDVHECVVLTIALAHKGPRIHDVPDASPRDAYQAHIRQLAGLTNTQILRIEVIWSPSAESDAMSKVDMMTNYPELVDIT